MPAVVLWPVTFVVGAEWSDGACTLPPIPRAHSTAAQHRMTVRSLEPSSACCWKARESFLRAGGKTTHVPQDLPTASAHGARAEVEGSALPPVSSTSRSALLWLELRQVLLHEDPWPSGHSTRRARSWHGATRDHKLRNQWRDAAVTCSRVARKPDGQSRAQRTAGRSVPQSAALSSLST